MRYFETMFMIVNIFFMEKQFFVIDILLSQLIFNHLFSYFWTSE
jgi:hypothetical protein